MSRCQWLGTDAKCSSSFLGGKEVKNSTIFDLSADCSPFRFDSNQVNNSDAMVRGNVTNEILATDPTIISAKANVSSAISKYL